MENIIGKLLEIDQAACKLVEDAAKQRESSLASLSDMKKSIYDSAMEDVRVQIEQRRSQAKTQTADEKKRLSAAFEANRSAIEATYNANMASWVDAIVENCTKL